MQEVSVEDDTAVEELLEWERQGLNGEYSPEKLLPTDPSHFTDLSGRVHVKSMGDVELAEGWVWQGDWTTSGEGEWFYAWNVTASSWRAKDGPTMHVRRRRWTRVRKAMGGKNKDSTGTSTRELVDLSALRVVLSCGGGRSRREISAMLGVEQSRLTVLSYTTPAAFLAAWARLFTADDGRTERVVGNQSVIVIYDLDDIDVVGSVLLPVLTESGEYRAPDGVKLLRSRFQRFAVVLAGWTGPQHLLIERLATDKGSIPPIRLAVARLE